MKTTITPEQALEQIKKGHLSQLKGLDPHGFIHVFDDAMEVILLNYYQNSLETTPAAIIDLNKPEILEYAAKAKGAFLQLVCGQNHDLSMDDIGILDIIIDMFPEGSDFSWDVEHTESPDFKMRIDLYIVTKQ